MGQRPKFSKACYVCGAPATSRDNVPPGGIFLKPRPSNLIRVPACERHNRGRSRDDEYFRLWMTTVCTEDPRAMKLFEGPVTRGLRHSQGLLKRWLAGAIAKVYVKSPGGIIIDEKPGFKIEPDRIQRVVDNIVRGIYHYELGRALPADCPVADYRTDFPDTPANRKFASALNRTYATNAGRDFVYRFGVDKEDSERTIVLMGFYRKLVILSGTGKRNLLVTRSCSRRPKEVAIRSC